MLKRTPLFQAHQQLGGRLIEFGGWEMPVQYTSIMEEHQAVRTAAGIFDISHMGEIFVSGVGAADFLNRALTNDIEKLQPGWGHYTLMCNPSGGVVDDLYAYCLGRGNYLLIVNASRIDADFTWLQSQKEQFNRPQAVFLENRSSSYGAVAVQGPSAASFIDRIFDSEPGAFSSAAKNEVRSVAFRGDLIYVSRTGYTGEDGFEIVAPEHLIEAVWWQCLERGRAAGLKPAGLGARDTLRTEMCYPLYGHELDEQTSPIEAGLGYFVALEKPNFTGSQILASQKKNGTTRKLAAFTMAGKSAPPRAGYPVLSAGAERKPMGTVTSGTQSPSLGIGIGLAYVQPAFAKPGTPIEIEIRGKTAPANVVSKPIYKKQQKTS